VLLDLPTQILDFFLVVVQAVAEVFLHVADFSFLGEQVEQVLHFEHIVLTNNRQSLLHLYLLASRVR